MERNAYSSMSIQYDNDRQTCVTQGVCTSLWCCYDPQSSKKLLMHVGKHLQFQLVPLVFKCFLYHKDATSRSIGSVSDNDVFFMRLLTKSSHKKMPIKVSRPK